MDGTKFHMARSFGTVREEARRGRESRYFIDCHVDGKRYKLRSAQLAGGQTYRFDLSREAASSMLESLRADLRHGRTVRQAIAPFLPRESAEIAFGTH